MAFVLKFSACTAVLVALMGGSDAGGGSYSYSNKDNWGDEFPTCNGDNQSPIVLDESNARYKNMKLDFDNYDQDEVTFELLNTGHTVKLTPQGADAYEIDLGKRQYVLAQLHFHWGANETYGSEHRLAEPDSCDEECWSPMELHFVHYDNTYSSLSEAVSSNKPKALAVLGVKFANSEIDNPYFCSLVGHLSSITSAGTSKNVADIPRLADWIPKNPSEFFRYRGSLTTPTCNEIVHWTVFRERIPISDSQVEEFRKIMDSDGSPIIDNHRNPQPLGIRTLKKSF